MFLFTVQGAEDRRQKFHFCRLSFAVNVMLNLSIIDAETETKEAVFKGIWKLKNHARFDSGFLFSLEYILHLSISVHRHVTRPKSFWVESNNWNGNKTCSELLC